MAEWSKVRIEDVRRGNVVDVNDSIGQVLSVRTVTALGPKLGHVELYLKECGPIVAPPGTTVDMFR